MSLCNMIAFLLLLALPLAAAAQSPTPSLLPLAQKIVDAAAAGNFAPVQDRFTPELNTVLTPDAVSAVKAQLFDPLGPVQSVTLTDVDPKMPDVAHFTVTLAKGKLTGVLAVNASGKVAGLRFFPPAAQADHVTKGNVHLPFHGTWFAFWGGTDPTKNHHYADRAQKFAYDMVIMKNGVSHTGAGTKNTDFYCFGQPVLAPVAGKVAIVVDGVPENTPGQTDPYMAFGNCIMIDDGRGEYLVLAHLQPHSAKVKVGDVVAVGQKLALCGNTGNSSEPHLHFHMQSGKSFVTSDGLPITFHDFVQDGTALKSGVAGGKVSLANIVLPR